MLFKLPHFHLPHFKKYFANWGRPYMTSDARGREGVKQNLMISDEGGGGVRQNLTSDEEKFTFLKIWRKMNFPKALFLL